MLFILNKNDQVIEILQDEDFSDDEYKQQINGEWIYTFHIDKINKNIVKENKVGFFDEDGKFQLFIIDDTEEVFNYSKKYDVLVSCLHDFYDLRFSVIEDKRVINGSARQALEKCLEGTSYSVGEVSALGNKNINFYFTNSLAGINEIIKTYGGEVYFRLELNENKTAISKKYVDIKYSLGEDTGLRFTFDLNLEEVKKKEHGDIFTVLYGRGSSLESGDGYSRKIDFADVEWSTPNNPVNKPIGQKYIENVEAIKRYGRKEGIFEENNIKDPEELLNATYEKLKECERSKVTYTVSVEDLSNILGYEHLKVKLGDSIIILDEEYNLLIEARIIEQRYSRNLNNSKKIIVLGNFIKGFSDSDSNSQIVDRLDKLESKPNDVTDKNFPNTLPSVPVVTTIAGFAVIELSWTYENKAYYTYEVYGSKIENFTPNFSNLIFKGNVSTFLHEVKPQETWYYRVRAINTHNKATEFSMQVSASTFKIADGTEYFESAAIKDALIGTLRLDRAWFGQLKGNKIDAREMSVTDGNGVRTVYISNNGNVELVGTIKSGNGDYFSVLSRGGLLLTHKNQEVGGIKSSRFASNEDINGLSIVMSPEGDYLDLGYSDREVLNPGAKYSAMMRFTRALHELTGNFIGIQLKANTRLDYGSALYFKNNSNYDSIMYASTGGHICSFGDNGLVFGYREGDSNTIAMQINETAGSSGSNIYMMKQMSMQDQKIVSVPDIYVGSTRTKYYHEGWVGSIEKIAKRISNLNVLYDTGVYSFSNGSNGAPCQYGTLIHIKWGSSGDASQLVIELVTGKLFTRATSHDVSSWSAWTEK